MNTAFSLIQSVSIIIASGVAIWGINSWRREAKWKRKYELAEEVLALFYECKEKFKIIRSPFGNTSEGKSRKRRENETAEESERLDSAYVFIERYENQKESFNKLFALKFRFMTLFGKQAEEPFNEIQRVLNEIFFAANRLGGRHWKDQGRNFYDDVQFHRHLKQMEEAEKVVWGDYDANDIIATRIDSCVSQIEKYCLQIMQK